MKNIFYLFLSLAVCAGLCACTSNTKKDQEKYNRKKIYLTEQDYLEDLEEAPYTERREAKPNTESNYIFEVQPDTQKNIYFFDDRNQPMVPGEPNERDYAKTKRLWEKPRRYSPEQYYGGQPPAADMGTDVSATSSYNEYDY